ncbi:hypothetical protein DSO57_1013009 [Entomophthora muscae]|uniref:Uncharacterized protein n=1 Tax=Entomophthora muscae TaxID=34485 RepID=A0ACC2URP8_9FUNG|nr:hypothetical protein DSO57_1013009 [Entomophthora muscae]
MVNSLSSTRITGCHITDSAVDSHKATGHGGIQKTLAQLQQHCYWKPCLSSEVQEKCIIHIEEEMIQFISMKLELIIISAAFQVALDELKRTIMCASFLCLILFKTSFEHNILLLTARVMYCLNKKRVAMNTQLVKALKFQTSIK